MMRQNNSETRCSLVCKVLLNFTIAMLSICIACLNTQSKNFENGYTNSIAAKTATVDDQGDFSSCKHPTFHPCEDEKVLNFKKTGYKWPVNSTKGTYTVGDQTFDISINDPDGIFGALHDPVDPDDIGSYENGTGIAIGINPHHRDDELEITYKLSKVSDNVAFTIRDLDKKNYQGSSKQIEKVCVYGYCDGEPVMPIITSLCGSVYVKNNCAVATKNSHESKKDESIRVVFDKCIDEMKIVYGNAGNAPKNPSYSKIYIGDDIGFGTALCYSKCKKCDVEPSCLSAADFAGCTIFRVNPGETAPVSVELIDPGSGDHSKWVATDESNIIIKVQDELPMALPEGIYNFYYINWNGELSASLNAGENIKDIINNSECAALGKPICVEVETRCTVKPSCASSGDFAGNCGIYCTNPDGTRPVTVSLDDPGSGENSKWVVTNLENIIVEVTDDQPVVLTEGFYNFYYINWNDELSAPLNVGANLVNIIKNSECAALGKPVCIEVKNCCNVKPSIAFNLNFVDGCEKLCTQDPNKTLSVGVDLIDAGIGDNSNWVITDESNKIVEVTDNLPVELAKGFYYFYYINWNGELRAPLNVGADLVEIIDNSECAALGEPGCLELINCCSASAATISLQGGDETLNVCVNDETLQTVNFTTNNAGSGSNSLWVITDENGVISSNLTMAPTLDLYNAPLGTSLIWLVNWNGSLSSPPNVFNNINQIIETSECAVLSNPVVIVKNCCCPYSIEFDEVGDICDQSNAILKASLVVDENLILDDGTIVCNIDGFRRCSADPRILDPNGDQLLGPIDRDTPGIFTATVDECRCAPDVETTIADLVQTACGDFTPAPPIPQVINVTENSATISCQHQSPVIIEFRKSGDITFLSYNTAQGNDMLFLSGLESCTSYEYRSRVTDANGNSITCAIQTLTTDGCRSIDITKIDLRTLNVGATSVVLTWDNMPGCVYTLYYRVKGQTQWKSYDTTISYIILFGLNPCTDYEWALKISENDLVSELSSTQLISTTCQGPRLSSPNAEDIKIGNLNDLQNMELDLFVNPSSKTLTVDCMGLPAKSFGIYNVNGQLVKSLNINNNNLNIINVSTLKAGIYFLITSFEKGMAKNKFLINK